jgi:hypothetical protein
VGKRRPKWQIEIDAYLFHYVDDPDTIRAQQQMIREMRLTGTRTTTQHYPREVSTPQGRTTKEESYILRMEDAQEQIALCKERRALVDKWLRTHFSPEEREFIRLFWLEVPAQDRGLIRVRNQYVIREIGWLRDPDDRRRPNSNYWEWRKRIYRKWWDLLWPDRAKGEETTEYAVYLAEEG